MASIDSYIHRKIVILHQQTLARQAARAMCEQNVGCVLVSNVKGELVGIVTDRDLACAMSTSPVGAEDVPISEIMTPNPDSVDVSVDIERVARMMEESGIRRVPVVEQTADGRPRCVGLVTLDDIIASQAIDYDRVARIVRAQIRRKWVKHYWKGADMLAQSRSEARREQTLNHFYKTVSEHAKIPAPFSNQVTQFLVGCLIRRLHYTGAAKFVAQLPGGMQEELLDLPAGPDRKISPMWMRQQIVDRFGFSDQTSASMVSGFFEALTRLISRDEIENLKAQLPEEFRALFKSGAPKPGQTLAA